MAQTDRTAFIGNTGVKQPCKAATTGNIVLSGEQTIDGVACVTDDRVLVKNQTDASENGIYNVDSGNWNRAADFDGAYNVVRGTMVRVNQGSLNADGWFVVATVDPITIGTTSLSFSRQNINNVTLVSLVATAGQTLFNLGTNYQVGANALVVVVNGLRLRVGTDYTETTASTVTFATALQVGDEVDFYIGLAVGNLTAALASAVAVVDAGDFYIGVTIESILQEIAQGVSADNGDASVAVTNGTDSRVQRWNTALTANRTLTLNAANAKEGARFTAVRQSGATGNFTLDVGGLATLRAPGEWAVAAYDVQTAAWILIGYGRLPSAEVIAMSADKGDASANLTVGTTERTVRWGTVLTAERTADLQAAGAYTGARFRAERLEAATGNFSLSVKTGASVLARLAPGQWADVEHTGSAWILAAMGNLRQENTNLVTLRDDYLGEEINGYLWKGPVGSDAACRAAIVLADQAGGVVRLTTGAGGGASMAVNGVQLNSQLNWRGNKGGLVWEGRVKIDDITTVALYVGLTDQNSALEMPFTLAGAALTSNASDACGVLFDTSATAATWKLVGVKADVDAAVQDSALAPVAATFETWRIEVDTDGTATFYRNGTLIGASMAGAVTPSAPLTPVIACFSRVAGSRNIDVDEQLVQQQR